MQNNLKVWKDFDFETKKITLKKVKLCKKPLNPF